MAHYKAPKRIVIVDDLPRTGTRKVQRDKLFPLFDPAAAVTPPASALFVPDGDGWRPTGYSRGPWSNDSLHGGPVAALLTRELERVERRCRPA